MPLLQQPCALLPRPPSLCCPCSRLLELAPGGAEGRALSQRVNARLIQLSALAPAVQPRDGADDDSPPLGSAATAEDPGGKARQRRRLGFLGGAAGDLPDLPRNVDDFLLWTTVPFIAPWPSWMLHEQLGDLAR